MKTITLVIAWTWVAVPLGWGVYQSVQKSIPLFHSQSTIAPSNKPALSCLNVKWKRRRSGEDAAGLPDAAVASLLK
jgi:hypothetical protein